MRGSEALVAALGFALGGCSRPPNVLLVTVDTLRADRVGAYGRAEAGTPNLDRLAADGALFEQAVAPAPLTAPSHATMLTGLYPARHGVRLNGIGSIDEGTAYVPSLLRDRGYATAAFVSCFLLGSSFGFGRGFERFGDSMGSPAPDSMALPAERRAEETVGAAISWLAEGPREPYFLWVHLFDPHAAYDPPEPFRTRHAADLYQGEIAYVDREVGRLLDAVDAGGRRERTAVLVAADHGEGLGEHDERTHSAFLYDSTIRVPLLARVPRRGGGVPGTRVGAQAKLADLAPTILELAGAAAAMPATRVDGRSLLPAIRGERTESTAAFCESLYGHAFYGWPPLFGLRSPPGKWIGAEPAEAYDLASDPKELRDLLAENRGREASPSEPTVPAPEGTGGVDPASLRTAFERERERFGADRFDRSEVDDPALRERLASLGYTGTASPRESTPPPDVAREVVSRIQDAEFALTSGDPDGAERGAREVLARAPRSVEAHAILAKALARTGRIAEAVEHYRAAAELLPTYAELWNNLGVALLRSERPDEAESALLRAVALHPRYPEARANLAAAYAARGDRARAAESVRAALALSPDLPFARAIASQLGVPLPSPASR